jgi:hypothetical protein
MAIEAFGPTEVKVDDSTFKGEGEVRTAFITLASLLVLALVAVAGIRLEAGRASSLRDPSVPPAVIPAAGMTTEFTHRVYVVDSEELAREVWAIEARTALLWAETGAVQGHAFSVIAVPAPAGRPVEADLGRLLQAGQDGPLVVIDARAGLED